MGRPTGSQTPCRAQMATAAAAQEARAYRALLRASRTEAVAPAQLLELRTLCRAGLEAFGRLAFRSHASTEPVFASAEAFGENEEDAKVARPREARASGQGGQAQGAVRLDTPTRRCLGLVEHLRLCLLEDWPRGLPKSQERWVGHVVQGLAAVLSSGEAASVASIAERARGAFAVALLALPRGCLASAVLRAAADDFEAEVVRMEVPEVEVAGMELRPALRCPLGVEVELQVECRQLPGKPAVPLRARWIWAELACLDADAPAAPEPTSRIRLDQSAAAPAPQGVGGRSVGRPLVERSPPGAALAVQGVGGRGAGRPLDADGAVKVLVFRRRLSCRSEDRRVLHCLQCLGSFAASRLSVCLRVDWVVLMNAHFRLRSCHLSVAALDPGAPLA